MEGIAVENVTKAYRESGSHLFYALNGVSMNVRPGECVSLVGESGSGKSTVARLLIGLERPTSGKITLKGEDTGAWGFGEWQRRRKTIQAVFQDASGTLNPGLSVYRNMEEALVNLTDLRAAQRKKKLYELMELTNIDARLLKVPTRQLSGGEQRRISLLRSLAVKPDYLVLDEVTSGLDLISADAVLTTLETYRQQFGCSYLFITHNLSSAFRLSDRILVIRAGKVVQEGQKKRERMKDNDSNLDDNVRHDALRPYADERLLRANG